MNFRQGDIALYFAYPGKVSSLGHNLPCSFPSLASERLVVNAWWKISRNRV